MYHLFKKKGLILLLSISTAITVGLPFGKGEAMEQPKSNQNQEYLSIGKKHLPESRTSKQLTTGVTYTKISRGYYSNKAYYTVDIGFFNSKNRVKTFAKKLKQDGYETEIHNIKNSPSKYTDVKEKEIGYVIQSGEFDDKQEAKKHATQMKEEGYEKASVTFSEYDGTKKTTGPWKINVIEINPDKFKGELTNILAKNKVQGRETISSMANRKNTIAGINGGYFVFSSQDGVPGDPAGVSITNGKLVSEAVGNRTSLVLSNNQPDIAEVSTKLRLETANEEKAVIDGINRQLGLIRSCGGVGDKTTNQPKHDVTCTDKGEIILYKTMFGNTTPEGEGFEVVLNEAGKVVETHSQRGHIIPKNGSVLSATKKQVQWLRDAVSIGDKLTITKKVYADGNQIKTHASLDVIGGAPQLLNNGKIDIKSKEEGFHWSKDFYYHFAQYRHPRSFAGIKQNGNILLVTVDGRNPRESIGVNFFESAKILKSLGAVEGMNLDGGGSSTMVVNNQLVNQPSDKTGERPVSDGIFILK